MNFPRFMHRKVFIMLIAWRLSAVFIVSTTHVPDEYWQSLEVAHKQVFGYGYLTWEWRIGIRSYFYPYLISILYSLLKFLQFDHAIVLVTLPRIFQALLSAYSDYRFYLWSGSKFALLNLCLNWYWYYCATRTLINSFETCLTINALAQYPWKSTTESTSKFLWIVGFLCFIRPTAVVVWLPLCLHHLFRNKYNFFSYLLIGIFCLSICITVDTLCYDKFILTPWEFFKVNVINNISEQYGKMPFHWYFTSGLPVLLGLNYIIFPLVSYRALKNYTQSFKSAILAFTTLWTVSIYSLLAHKEFRFILPILPMIIYIIHDYLSLKRISNSKRKLFIALLVIANVIPGIYFSIFHQQGALKVMKTLRTEINAKNTSDINILFLTTCHATPYFSHLHKNVSMRFLTCEPNLGKFKDYYDESDEFLMNPMKWLEANYLNKSSINLPSHVIVYDTTVDRIIPFLKYYKELRSIVDTHFIQHEKFNQFVIYKQQTVLHHRNCTIDLRSKAKSTREPNDFTTRREKWEQNSPTFSRILLVFTPYCWNDQKSLDEICEALDDLTIQNLELMEEKISLTVQLENTIRQGHIDLAKARYIRGRETIGLLQIPYETSDIKTLFDLETTYVTDEKTDAEEIPTFDISLKKLKEGEEELQDPIKWFGVLVPQSLKSAQKHFQDALYLTVRLANVQSKLVKVNDESNSLKLLKKAAV